MMGKKEKALAKKIEVLETQERNSVRIKVLPEDVQKVERSSRIFKSGIPLLTGENKGKSHCS